MSNLFFFLNFISYKRILLKLFFIFIIKILIFKNIYNKLF